MFLKVIKEVPCDRTSQSCHGEFCWCRSWTIQGQFLIHSDPFCKIAHCLETNILKPFVSCIACHLLNDHFKNFRPPHSRTIGISKICKPFVGLSFKRCLGDFLFQELDKISIIFLSPIQLMY